jgi:S-adenosylmethionine hydrolase
MTDYGTANDSVAICKAILVRIAPDARLMDITHQVTPFSIEEGARFLAAVTPYYPSGTVFLVVVDPGVGTARKSVAVRTKRGQLFVLPDNGLVTPVVDRDGLDAAREITNAAWMLETPRSSTFHGRDVFSPAAAHLAAGWPFEQIGPPVTELVRLAPKTATVTADEARGDVIALDDPYGSLVTNVPGDALEKLGYRIGDKVTVVLNGELVTLPFVKTFGDVPVGESLLYVDSRGRLGLAVNEGNYSRKFHVEPPGTISIAKKGTPPRKGK